MTTQVWLPVRFTVPTLLFSPPATFNMFANAGAAFGPSSRLSVDMRPYVSGGRAPYTYSISSVPTATNLQQLGISISSARGIISGPRPQQGSLNIPVTVADAYGTVVTVNIKLLLAQAPFTATAVYPNIHNGVYYNYAPTISGGVPPYSVTVVGGGYPGINPNLSGLVFDPSSGSLSGLPVWASGTGSAGQVWEILVRDSAGGLVDIGGSLLIFTS